DLHLRHVEGEAGRRRRGARDLRARRAGPAPAAAVRPGDPAGPQRRHGRRLLGPPRRARGRL
ncbi:MAG: hypothetical protein AVDCRST_MAG36-1398, partial [uncultured Nocardioidaceae bacterium]